MANVWVYVEKELVDLEAEVNALLVERNRLLNRSDKAEKLVLQNLLYTVGCGLTGAFVGLDWLPLSLELFSAKMEIRRLNHERGNLRTKILSLHSLAVTLAGGLQSEATRLGELIPSQIESRTESVLDSIGQVPGVEREIKSSERRIWYMGAATVAVFLGSCLFHLGMFSVALVCSVYTTISVNFSADLLTSIRFIDIVVCCCWFLGGLINEN